MFNILETYILKKFISIFFFILLGLSIIIGVVDFTNKTDIFINHNLTTTDILVYYCAFLPFIINFLTPIIIFISSVFLTFRISQRSEIIAMLSIGVSYKRFLKPYLICSLIIASFSFFLNGWILPKSNKVRIDYEDQLGFSFLISKPKYIHIKISPNEYLFIDRYRTTQNFGTNATIEKIENSQMIEKFYAEKISWLKEKNTWVFSNWIKKEITEWGEKINYGDSEERPVNLKPSDLNINPRLYEQLTLPELHNHIVELKNKQSNSLKYFLVEAYIRYMAPFAALILTFLGVLVSSKKMRNGAGKKLSLGVALAFIYIYMFLFSRNFAENNGGNMFLIIWTPNILFSIICYFMYKKVQK